VKYAAKRLLGNKIILSHILVKTIDEFKEINVYNKAANKVLQKNNYCQLTVYRFVLRMVD